MIATNGMIEEIFIERLIRKGMEQITINVTPEVKAALQQEAAERGQGIQDLVEQIVCQQALRHPNKLTSQEIDQILNQLAAGGENLCSLPSNFSREDIYFDHD